MDPYAAGLAEGRPRCRKRDVEGEIVVVLDTRREGRGLELIHPYTRAFKRNDVHELIVTDEETGPGDRVQGVCGLGFVEIVRGGVVMVGDEVRVDGRRIGTVAGFDLSHSDNHLNVVVHSEGRLTGIELGLALGDRISFGS